MEGEDLAMDFEERPLLHFPDLVLALLRAAADRAATVADAARLLAVELVRAREAPQPESGELAAHLDHARRHLVAARLLDMLDGRRFRITPRGRASLHTHPEGIDDCVLAQFPEFRAWLARTVAAAADPRGAEFQRGWAAQAGGGGMTDNPYASDTAQHGAWEDGWLEADRCGRERA
jgi:hypothetical protein